MLLADITGYTAYLQATELEHADDVLADLLETLVGTLAPIFTLSKLEGDAAFSYAPDGRVSPSLILDTVEAGYFAFRRRLRDIDHATSCECNACLLIPALDLKYFVHHGAFVARRIAGSEELTGSDVVLVHRLMKSQVGSELGTRGYALYTAAALETFGMDPNVLGFSPHTDQFDDVGTVDSFVEDLTTRWAFENERNRVFLTDTDARWSKTWELPVPVEIAWDFVTDSGKRMQWSPAITGFEMQTSGRVTTGSVNHCMHGSDVIVEHVADWRPFSYFTKDYPMSEGDDASLMRLTYDFDDRSDPPTMTLRIGGTGAGFDDWWVNAGEAQIQGVEENAKLLRELFEEQRPSVS